MAQLPLADSVVAACGESRAMELAVNGGDDYELLFTLPPRFAGQLDALSRSWSCAVTRIGVCESGQGARWLKQDREYALPRREYRHF